jgi:glycosyltransferase involved in cell wall biosynthesis
MPEVSVIIPSFNCADYIAGSIDSVLRQTLQDFEIIVVDDGSADDTRRVIDRYLVDPRFRYIHQPNCGLPGARNTGARAARAPYLAFLDADDALDAGALEKMWTALARSEACWCVIDLLKVCGAKSEMRKTQVPAGNLFYGILRDDFIRRGMFLRRDVFMAVGMYDEEMKNREDWDLNIRMLERGKAFVYVPEPLYLYSWREGSITTGNPAKMLFYTERVLRKHHKRLADSGDALAAKLYAENLWELARKHFYGSRNIRKALACMRESFIYDMSLRRLLHPVFHQFQRLVTS